MLDTPSYPNNVVFWYARWLAKPEETIPSS